MNQVTITDLDARILKQLQNDASQSVAELAERVNSSSATCWRRIRYLEAQGILGKHVRLVDPASLGRSLDAFCQVRLKQQDAQTRNTFHALVDQEPTIIAVYSTSGEWDYMLHLLVRDIADLENILMGRVLENDSVAATATTFALRRIKHVTEVPI